jgi:S-adenosylmethionine decarboxylase
VRGGSRAGRLNEATRGVGRHLIVELFGCDDDLMKDASGLLNLLVEAAEQSGASIVGRYAERFGGGGGVSAIVVIKESHIAIHTWPEIKYASVDIFTCGEKADPWKAYEIIVSRLNPRDSSVFEIIRGVAIDRRVSIGVETYEKQAKRAE